MMMRSAIGFTGKERDAESGLDYFGARYFSGAHGRFTSPDSPFADQKPEDPQSWNLYAYVRNNPLKFVDTDGHVLQLAQNASRGERKNYSKAIAYVSRDAGLAGIIGGLQGSATTYTVEIIHNGNDRFDPNTNTVYWDPKSSLAVENQAGNLTGDTQTPALGLAHELDHAAAKDQGILAPKPDAQYGTTEEKRVITGSETQAAGTQGEPTRQNHGGAAYESKNSTSTKPTRKGKKELRQEEVTRGQQQQRPHYNVYDH